MPPGRVGIGVPLALLPALGDGTAGRSRRRAGRKRRWRGRGHTRGSSSRRALDYAVETTRRARRAMLAELVREAVGGIDARDRVAPRSKRARCSAQCSRDQRDSACPGRHCVERLRQCQPDHRPNRVARSARRAGGFEVRDQSPNLGRVERFLSTPAPHDPSPRAARPRPRIVAHGGARVRIRALLRQPHRAPERPHHYRIRPSCERLGSRPSDTRDG